MNLTEVKGKYYQVILNEMQEYETLQHFLYQARHFCLTTVCYSFGGVGYKSTNTTKTLQIY